MIIFQFTWHSAGHLGACWGPNCRENRWRGSDSFGLSNSPFPLDGKTNCVVWGKVSLSGGRVAAAFSMLPQVKREKTIKKRHNDKIQRVKLIRKLINTNTSALNKWNLSKQLRECGHWPPPSSNRSMVCIPTVWTSQPSNSNGSHDNQGPLEVPWVVFFCFCPIPPCSKVCASLANWFSPTGTFTVCFRGSQTACSDEDTMNQDKPLQKRKMLITRQESLHTIRRKGWSHRFWPRIPSWSLGTCVAQLSTTIRTSDMHGICPRCCRFFKGKYLEVVWSGVMSILILFGESWKNILILVLFKWWT